MSDLNEILIPHLVREEGFVPHCYDDHLGYRTIGIGRMVDKRKGGKITRFEAQFLLENDIKAVTKELDRKISWWRTLDDVRQAVFAGMAFQMGVPGFLRFKATIKHVWDGNYDKAAVQMRRSLWAKQTPARAERLARAMETGDAGWLAPEATQ